MNRMTIILIATLLAVPLVNGCSESPLVPYGSLSNGMPDWDDPRNDFIADIGYECLDPQPRWTPSFNYPILGVSPDGRELLMSTSYAVLLYDYRTATETLIMPGGATEAAWSRDGRYIVVSQRLVPEGEQFAVWDCVARVGWTIRLPATFADVNTSVRWLPGDTTILIRVTLAGDSTERLHEVDVRSPFEVRPYSRPHFDAQANGRWYALEPSDGRYLGSGHPCYLRVGTFDRGLEQGFYLAGMYRASQPRISPDGNWLATEVTMSAISSRFSDVQPFIDGLGIIDLRPGSPTRYRLAAFFPDHTHFDRACLPRVRNVGAWDADSRHMFFERVRASDTTIQIVRFDVRTGDEEIVSDFK